MPPKVTNYRGHCWTHLPVPSEKLLSKHAKPIILAQIARRTAHGIWTRAYAAVTVHARRATV